MDSVLNQFKQALAPMISSAGISAEEFDQGFEALRYGASRMLGNSKDAVLAGAAIGTAVGALTANDQQNAARSRTTRRDRREH